MKLLCSWSGGKDSCFALMQMNQAPTVLLNALNEGGEISRSHGIPKEVLQAQAAAIGVPIAFISATWEAYTEKYVQQLRELSQEYQLTDAVFGDIDLQPHRDWEEQVCTAAGISCNLPLWQQDRKELVHKMINAGIKTMIVSCNDHLGME
jgi:diphthine-ammonia ligase